MTEPQTSVASKPRPNEPAEPPAAGPPARQGYPRRAQAIWLAAALVSAVAAGLLAWALVPSRAFQVLAVVGIFIMVFGLRTTIGFYRELIGRIRGWRGEPVRHHKLSAAPGLLFCGVLAFILLGVLFWPSRQVAEYDNVVTSLGAVFALLVLPPLYRAASRIGHKLQTGPAWVRPAFLGVVLSAILLVQLRIGYALQVLPGWDAGAVIESAIGVATGSMATFYEYFAIYPNNLVITVGLTKYSQLMVALGVPAGDLLYAAVVLNCLVLCASVLLTYLCARHLINEGAAVFTLLPSALYIMFSPYISVVYSDSLGIIFPVLLLYLHLKAVRARTWQMKLVLWVLLGAVTAVGYNLKPTAVFATAAILGVYVVESVLRRNSAGLKVRVVAAVLGATGLGFVAAHTAIWADIKAQSYIGFDVEENTRAFPLTHFLMMGATGSGSFTQEDVFTTGAIQDPDERFRHGLEVYGERVGEMGYPGYLQFLDRKAVGTFGDGSFHSWAEGLLLEQQDPFPINDPLSNEIQDYMFGNGVYYGFTSSVWHSVWLALLFLVALPLRVRTPRILTPGAAIMRWSLLALTLFLLFFETRSRYLYLYLPYFALLAALTMDALLPHGPAQRAVRQSPADGAGQAGKEAAT